MVACICSATAPVNALEHALKEVGLGTQESEAEPVAINAARVSSTGADIQLQRTEDSVFVTASLSWMLPELVLEALFKGIPVHFVADAKLSRQRWYWRNEALMQAQRFWRLSYQPLTRRWRLYVGNVPFDGKGLGTALASSYDSLEDALNAMRRVVRWRLGTSTSLPSEGEALLEMVFRIDLSQFPRPLQIGALGRADWNMLVTRKQAFILDHL